RDVLLGVVASVLTVLLLLDEAARALDRLAVELGVDRAQREDGDGGPVVLEDGVARVVDPAIRLLALEKEVDGAGDEGAIDGLVTSRLTRESVEDETRDADIRGTFDPGRGSGDRTVTSIRILAGAKVLRGSLERCLDRVRRRGLRGDTDHERSDHENAGDAGESHATGGRFQTRRRIRRASEKRVLHGLTSPRSCHPRFPSSP